LDYKQKRRVAQKRCAADTEVLTLTSSLLAHCD